MLVLVSLVALAGSDGEQAFADGVAKATAGDPTAAAALWTTACEAGHSRACSNLATLTERGIGVPADPVRAARLHRSACDADLALSCDALGTLTTNGSGVLADDAAAVALYRKACTLGHGPGCTHLAVMLDGGFGVPRSWEDARVAYAAGCDAGDPDACWSLGRKLLGLRRPEVSVEGAARVARACELDHAEACAVSADLHQMGELLPRDPKRADELRSRACTLGHALSCR